MRVKLVHQIGLSCASLVVVKMTVTQAGSASRMTSRRRIIGARNPCASFTIKQVPRPKERWIGNRARANRYFAVTWPPSISSRGEGSATSAAISRPIVVLPVPLWPLIQKARPARAPRWRRRSIVASALACPTTSDHCRGRYCSCRADIVLAAVWQPPARGRKPQQRGRTGRNRCCGPRRSSCR
jgi:hypothetical protein